MGLLLPHRFGFWAKSGIVLILSALQHCVATETMSRLIPNPSILHISIGHSGSTQTGGFSCPIDHKPYSDVDEQLEQI